jgi:assimilatory nitrate reductase catalytic subunit
MDLLAALGGPVRGLMVMASNILVSAPDAGAVASRMRDLDFLVVVDPFLSETAAIADVVLPAAQWAEEDGTMTNLEGRILLRRQATQPPEGVWTDLRILRGLADRLGAESHFSASAAEVFSELRAASSGGGADYAGVSYERIAAEDGIFWPCPEATHAGTPNLFETRFATDDGRATFFSRGASRPGGDTLLGLPVFPDDRPAYGPLPVGHADAARAGTRRRPTGPIR